MPFPESITGRSVGSPFTGSAGSMAVPKSAGWCRDSLSAEAEQLLFAEANVVGISVFHELGSDLAGGTITETRRVGPSKRATLVTVTSHVIPHSAQAIQSPEYMETVRRRRAGSIAEALSDLAPHAARDDFAVCTYPVVKKISELLETLINAQTEGNTREILRQLRNTLMNGGWRDYRDAKVRKTAIAIVRILQEAEEVTPQQVEEAFDQLHDAGLNPVGPPIFADSDENEGADVQAQVSG